MSIVFLLLVKLESDWAGNELSPLFAGEHSLGFHRFELRTSLLAVTDRVVRAEWYLFAAWKQELLATLHQIFLVEGPRVHEILQHDHDHVIRNVAHLKPLWRAARFAGQLQLVNGLLRAGN